MERQFLLLYMNEQVSWSSYSYFTTNKSILQLHGPLCAHDVLFPEAPIKDCLSKVWLTLWQKWTKMPLTLYTRGLNLVLLGFGRLGNFALKSGGP